MKKITLGIIIVVLLFALSLAVNYFFIWNTVQIDDVTQKTVITLSSNNDKVHYIRIIITGNIDGNAVLQLSDEEGNSYKYEIKQGKVHLPIGSDWYHDKCLIKYEPIGVKSGKLKIRYRFLSL